MKKDLVDLTLSFPYHYGSYATRPCQVRSFLKSLGFHTTMVLTQLVDGRDQGIAHRVVSIPLWFLRNL